MGDQRKATMPSGCGCGPPPHECLSDDEYVTQLTGRNGQFRNAPRVGVEVDFSVHRGRLSLAATYTKVTKDSSPLPEELQNSGVRYALTGDLRTAGFTVVHTPGKIIDGTHTSIVWAGEDLGEVVVPWPEKVSETFGSCFDKPIPHSDEADDA
ncbi:hypothetical protein [Cellulomonas fengjieae]|uniref:Uncharacterized protein n=1 Tax=Cellulomonas fengjieae TaxID=2819978 RepID=A0ABS3SMM9_9CELL|nr:hypothetical protein [Cellulomonas fengjieae]MBO3086584.1 hypothetical protein [Cellulomonas fengjieae]QVI66563.1 hypothetical protein KG102_02865 [Cellulomonas fengjieae]